ncbi:MAG TPA: fasciclin domain-containing protein [Candidatus Elarobacter sp.]|jgi:uncharacterized surface protein with fasciclin (FAS1) repeats|nr:fasciclin domain-containing protein [Candidatus Elarobacter sp.]
MRLTRAAACRSFAGCLLALTLAAPALAQRPATVLDLAAQQKNLSTFVSAVHTAGLDDMLRGPGPLTIYAPTDDAFAKMPAADRTALLGDPSRLRTMILDLVVKDNVVMRDGDTQVSSGSIGTAGGKELTFALDGERTTVSGAHLVRSDLKADNGCVHEIDTVLVH